MPFKENLLKKIQIEALARKVLGSLGPSESGAKLDKDAMRELLGMSPFRYHRERDLDLYILEKEAQPNWILVLDNELPIYQTTVEDVAVRKSPYIGEMVKIGNIIKILKDSDVKINRKEESVKAVREKAIGLLDLSYDRADIEAIAEEGVSALENGYSEGIEESLALFAELLGYRPAPKPFQARHHVVFGDLAEKAAGEIVFGPLVIYSRIDNSLRLLTDQISSLDKNGLAFFQQVVKGEEKAAREGGEVFKYLRNAILGS